MVCQKMLNAEWHNDVWCVIQNVSAWKARKKNTPSGKTCMKITEL